MPTTTRPAQPTDTAVAIEVLANDTDPNGDDLTITASDSPTANGGTTAINDNGTPGDPTDDFIDYTPATGFAGTDTFTYTIDDGNGGTDTATVTVTVNNAAPVANDDAVSTPTDTALAIDVLANDSDPNGDQLTITAATPRPPMAARPPSTTTARRAIRPMTSSITRRRRLCRYRYVHLHHQ